MSGSSRIDSPLPLESWIYTIAILLALLLLVAPIVNLGDMPDSNAFTNYNKKRLAQMLDDDPDQFVAMFGDSKLKYAIDTEMPGARDGWALFRVVQNRAVFRDFAGLDTEVIAAGPDLIVIQDSLLYHDRLKAMDFRLAQELVMWQLFAPDSEFNPFRTDQEELQESTPCSRDFSMEALDRRLSRIDEDSSYGVEHRNSRAAQEFVNRAVSLGIKVVILPLPVHPRLRAELPLSERDAMTHEMARQLKASVWELPEASEFGEDDYCDFVHLNVGGRQKLSSWLDAKIAEAIGSQR